MTQSGSSEAETNAMNQTSIEPAEDNNRLLDFMIEFGIHNDLTATVGATFKELPRHKMCQLRRITLKCTVIYYAQTVVLMNERNKLIDALTCLQKIFEDVYHEQDVVKCWQALQRGMQYQIIMHHLQSCGPESALQMIDTYFPQQASIDTSSEQEKDNKYRDILLEIATKFRNGEQFNHIKWGQFKNWVKPRFATLLKSCGKPIIEQIAQSNISNSKKSKSRRSKSKISNSTKQH